MDLLIGVLTVGFVLGLIFFGGVILVSLVLYLAGVRPPR